ncbi:MAG: hypothetical protein ACOCVC_08425, partial [Spirochaeta sp.]
MKRGCAAAVLLFWIIPSLYALNAELVSNEITLVLAPNGTVQTHYSIEWNVTSGTMGAFYFEGEAYRPEWNYDGSFVDLADGRRL